MTLPKLPKLLSVRGLADWASLAERVYEWVSAAQDLLSALRAAQPGVLSRLDDLEDGATGGGGVSDHGALTGLGDDDHTQYLRTDGTRALTGNQSAGGHKITSLAASTTNGDAVRHEDARLSDARTPTAHAASHSDGAGDPIDVTDLDGYPGGTSNFLRADGTFAAPSGGFTPARYSGHATAGVSWTSTTWSGVAVAATLVDVDQIGISRSGSAFTFTAAGEYVVHFAAKAFRTVGADIGIRARLSGATVGGPSLSSTESSSRMTIARLHKCLTLGAGDVVTLEYAVTSGFASAAAATLDGDAGHVCDIEIYRVC